LLVAVGFTALANVLLLAALVYDEWLPRQTRLIGVGALAVVWLLSRLQTRAERRAIEVTEEESETDEAGEPVERPPAERDQWFREAQGHYLRNDWVATEQTLLKLLKQDARDIESRLMLATLWRHQGRTAEATRQLDRLARLEAAEEFEHEIAAERAAIEAENETNNKVSIEDEHVSVVSPKRNDPEASDHINDDDLNRDNDLRHAA